MAIPEMLDKDAMAKLLIAHYRDQSPFVNAFLRRRDPMAEAERIGKAVAKLKSCSKAGRQWIVDERCMYAGLHPQYFKFKRRDEHLMPKHTPIGHVPVRTVDWSTVRIGILHED